MEMRLRVERETGLLFEGFRDDEARDARKNVVWKPHGLQRVNSRDYVDLRAGHGRVQGLATVFPRHSSVLSRVRRWTLDG